MIFGLVFVICLIYLTGFIYQKLVGINTKLNKKVLDIPDLNKAKIVSTTPTGQGQNLLVVEVNGKILLIGATPSNINLLREFSMQEIADYQKMLNELEKDDEEKC